MLVPIRRLALAFALCCALVVGTTAYADSRSASQHALGVSQPSPTPTEEERKLAKTRFAVDAGLAAGATYEWIVKPFKAGKFKKGHHGRTMALVKAGLAGAFAYNRLKAAVANAEADPALSKALAPLTAGIEGLKNLPHEFHRSDSPDATVNSYQDAITKVKDAGASAGAPVQDQVPSPQQLMSSP
ncbi:hypothetical protein [Streptomyces subrutilus]|uniref:Uncharacterized protein n=1 Tax=Streptomyces subrutilus TaxID=36818 RepID=A0A1E5P0Q1_9ACTN|nr:hypothetical protein [Streptomyces subrutilus]OEJ22581.1 hypothetical protein BGK67_34290 [Streptomyces subrutilus]